MRLFVTSLKMSHNYTYKIEFETGHTYYGVRSCKCLPEEDPYLGSPKTHKNYWTEYEPKKTVLKEFKTRGEAFDYETELIKNAWAIDKSLSLNASISNKKFSMHGSKPTAETVAKIVAKNAKPYFFISPDGEEFSGVNRKEFARNNNLSDPSLIAVIQAKILHHHGWTISLAAHNLYVTHLQDRGLHYHKTVHLWLVQPTINGSMIQKSFKTKEEATNYRDELEDSGYSFRVQVRNWKEKLKELNEK